MKLGTFRILSLGWLFIKELSSWYSEASKDGKINLDDFSGVWLIFGKLYTEITGKQIEINVNPDIKFNAVNIKEV